MVTAYSYIRFSTPEQLKGDSLRRQLAASEAYAKEHGLELDTSLNMRDLGVSAFTGQHVAVGNLGKFLEAVRTGKVEPGSYLLIENLDRLSRQKVWDAVELLRSILRAGVNVVELHGGKVLTQENVDNDIGTILSVVIQFLLANTESEKKSKRLKEVWGERREQAAQGAKVGSRGPAWLERGQPIPDRVTTIQMLFELYVSGHGVQDIVRQLNANPDVWHPKEHYRNKDGRWSKNYANKLLGDRRLIGECRWGKMVNGRSQPVGEPIPNYYPVVIDPDLFHRALAVRATHALFADNGGGRTGANNNVFRRLTKCAICGERMEHISKGRPPKGNQYLVCSKAHDGLKCSNKKAIRYDRLKPILIYHTKGFDARALLLDESQKAFTTVRRQALEGQIRELERAMDSIEETMFRPENASIKGRFEAAA